MFGFIIGFASLFGLMKVLRGGRGFHRRQGRGFRRRWMRGLFERLDTTPGQEKVIRDALDDVMDEAASARRTWPTMRSGLGAAFGPETLDDAALQQALAEGDERMARLRTAFEEALKRIHEVLDPAQRQTLARWLSRGAGAGPMGFGPYR